MYHVLGIELHMKRKFTTECLIKRHRSTAEYFYWVTQSASRESQDAERGFRMLSGDFEQASEKRITVWNFEKCFVLKVGRGST
jgi:hypothetical protein